MLICQGSRTNIIRIIVPINKYYGINKEILGLRCSTLDPISNSSLNRLLPNMCCECQNPSNPGPWLNAVFSSSLASHANANVFHKT